MWLSRDGAEQEKLENDENLVEEKQATVDGKVCLFDMKTEEMREINRKKKKKKWEERSDEIASREETTNFFPLLLNFAIPIHSEQLRSHHILPPRAGDINSFSSSPSASRWKMIFMGKVSFFITLAAATVAVLSRVCWGK